MLQHLKRPWNYLTDRLPGRVEQTPDPKLQLEKAISEAMEKHRRLRGHAAKVIANQKQTEMRLHRSIEELTQATSDTRAAEPTADRLVTLEQEVESLESLHFQASEAADQAKTAVSQDAAALQQKLSHQHSLLGRLDQAKTQEQVDAALQSLSEGMGPGEPFA